MCPDLFTAGYEGKRVDELVGRLVSAGVRRLIDVRAVAQSRKPGFSKRALAAAVEEAGLSYVHLRALGTPKPGRQAARRGDRDGLERIFGAHLETPEAQAGLAEAAGLARGAASCLLCFEADPTCCHRTIVARLLCEGTPHRLVEL